MSTTLDIKRAAKRSRKMAPEPQIGIADQTLPTRRSKTDLVLELLTRSEGATLGQLVAETGWLPHTARAALTGLKKKGHVVTSARTEGGPRVYWVVTA